MADVRTIRLGVQYDYPIGQPCSPNSLSTIHLQTWGPVVTMVSVIGISSGAPPPGLEPAVCPGGTSVLVMLGVPQALGVYTYTIEVLMSDSSHLFQDCVHTVDLVVGCPTIVLQPIPADMPDGYIDQIFELQFNGSAGVAPFVFDILDGSVPPGLTFTAAGLLSGIPTTLGTYNFVIRLIDQNGCTAVSAYTMDITVGSEVDLDGGGGTGGLTGEDTPLVWVEFSLIVGAFSQVYRWAKVDLADRATYFGGFKQARLLVAGSIRRALSDWRGNYEAASWTITLSDADRLLRGLLAGADSRYMLNKFALMRMISDAGRRLLQIPRIVAIGILRDYQPINPLQFSLTFEDYLALFTGLGSQEKAIPKRQIPLADFPDCPVSNRKLPVPVWYGDLSSGQSATAAPVITGDPDRGFYTDEGYFVGGYGNLASDVDPTTVVVIGEGSPGSGSMSNDVPNGTWGVMITGVDADDRESDPFPFYHNQPGGGGRGSFPLVVPTVALSDGTRKITVSWDAMTNAVKYRVYLGWYYYGFSVQQAIETASLSCEFTTAPSWLTPSTPANTTPAATYPIWGQGWTYRVAALMADGITALSADCTNISMGYRRLLRVQWQPISGALEYYVYRYPRLPGASADRQWTISAAQLDGNGIPYFDDDLLDTGATIIDGVDTDTGNVPVIYVGTRVDDSGSAAGTWFAFLICGHAIKEITAVFQGGIQVDPGNFGVTFAVPGHPGFSGYFSADPGDPQYRDINGHRYTLLYVRGPQGEQAKDGSKPITVNLKGIEDVGDGSGDLITDAFDVQLHAYRNWIFGDYQTGDWPSSGPTWPNSSPAVQVIDDASFAVAKAVCSTRMAGGYTAAFGMGVDGEFLQVRDWIQRFNLSCACWSGFSRKSQWMVRVMDDSLAPLDAAERFTDVRDVFGAPDVHDSPNDLENVVVYSHTRKWALKTWGGIDQETPTAAQQPTDPSIVKSGQTKKSRTIEMWLVRNATMAGDVAQRRRLLTKEPPRTVVFTVGLRGMQVELGDVVKLTTAQGIGSSGWEDRAIFITRHELNPDRLTVRLEGIDVGRIFAGAFILGDESSLPATWTSASTAQKRYGYLGDETTEEFSDGVAAKRLR